ncbi:MAG: glutamine amidotransferase [Acidobacteria bacterium]|nr:MAG: glutamine amidotransferase [Acidobacteriota bacterium]REK09784.1 MAG: glutamine amidotransferase [Acidobacteriota bacterium]
MTHPKPVLVLQLRPEDETADSELAAILRYGGLEPSGVRRIRLERTPLPDLDRELDLDDFAAIVVGGSPFDVSTPREQKSELQLRIESDFRQLLERVLERDFPFLGCCSGCGLLGDFLQTPISGRYAEPVGGATVTLTPAGLDDPLLEGFPQQIQVLRGHKEACDVLPRGATLLMTSDACPVQMFRVGHNVYATQFHPEADPEGFVVRIQAYRHHGYFAPEEADALIAAVTGFETAHAQELLRRFVARYVG